MINLNDCFEKLSQGEKSAFSDIYDELKIPVYTIAYRITQKKELSEDIAADTFLKFYVSPPDSSVKNKRAYVFKIARNLAIDALRKKQSISIDGVEISDTSSVENIALRMDIEEAMKKLSYEEREIVSLHINGELKFSEISKIVGLSLPSVFRRYQKAIKALQKILSGGIL